MPIYVPRAAAAAVAAAPFYTNHLETNRLAQRLLYSPSFPLLLLLLLLLLL